MQEQLVQYMLDDVDLSTLVGERIRWDERPQGEALPAVVVSQSGGVRDYHMQGASGFVESRVTVECWALTKAAALEVARAVRDRLSGLSLNQSGVEIQGAFIDTERHDADTGGEVSERYHRISLDFTVWHSEGVTAT